MTLHEWAVHHGSDKGKAHKYCDFYQERIGTPKTIIEFGVLNGASLEMWRDMYPGSIVIGLDIEPKVAPLGTYVFMLDAALTNWIIKLKPSFDLIIDDASHKTIDQMSSFAIWWPLVSKGGHYIIEDCHTMHYKEYNPNAIDFKAWVKNLGIKHEYYNRVKGDESDSMTVIFYK